MFREKTKQVYRLQTTDLISIRGDCPKETNKKKNMHIHLQIKLQKMEDCFFWGSKWDRLRVSSEILTVTSQKKACVEISQCSASNVLKTVL